MRFLGEAFEESQLDVDRANSSFDVRESGIYTSAVSRWRSQLSAEEVWLIQKVARHEFALFGYEVEPVRPRLDRLAILVLGLPWAVARALHAHRAVRGPLLPYLLKRLT